MVVCTDGIQARFCEQVDILRLRGITVPIVDGVRLAQMLADLNPFLDPVVPLVLLMGDHSAAILIHPSD